MTDILVFGRNGQLARSLASGRWPHGFQPIFLDRSEADFNEPGQLAEKILLQRPALVIIAAAFTAVDAAEDDAATAMRVNAAAPEAIAQATAALGIPVIHVSTDYVFDGGHGLPYTEADTPKPLNVYGRSKLAGEQLVAAANPHHIILRTSWVYSAIGRNFVKTMIRAAETRDEVSVVADQFGNPTAAGDLADAIIDLVPHLLRGSRPFGLFHAAGAESASWHEFAEAIFNILEERGRRRPANKPIATADWPTPAKRPLDSRLACGAASRRLGIRLRGYSDALPGVIDAVLASQDNAERVAS